MTIQNEFPETICTHTGDDPRRFHGSVVPPIYENSLFVFESLEAYHKATEIEHEEYIYTRGVNPTVEIAEQKIATLEGGEKCRLFASGMAAISAAILSSVQSGDHVLCVGNIYGPTLKLLNYLGKFGVDHSQVSSTQIDPIEQAIQANTRLIYLESPTTMTMRLVDLPAVAGLARSKGIKTLIDNTWATPLFQKPLEIGIDMVVHSATKYLSGHSDVMGGALITDRAMLDRLFYREYQLFGGIMAPFEAWLLTRGLRTLPIRMKAHQESALKVAQFLETNPVVKLVNYPGLPSHPDYELGKRQLKGYSGLMSFELKSDSYEALKTVINSLMLFQIGVSWGGFESLVIAPYNGKNADSLRQQGIDPGLIRISVGLENADQLIADLDRAFKQLR